MDLTLIREALKGSLESIRQLRCHDVWPDQIVCPAVLVQPVGCEFASTFDGGYKLSLEVVLLAAPMQTGYTRGQNALDPYLASSGDQSVKYAAEADPALDGEADSVLVRAWRNYGRYDVGDVAYWGVTFDLEVLG